MCFLCHYYWPKICEGEELHMLLQLKNIFGFKNINMRLNRGGGDLYSFWKGLILSPEDSPKILKHLALAVESFYRAFTF